jgi:GxxExxY protein
LEAVYQEAMAVEMGLRGIPFRREVDIPVGYKGHQLKAPYRVDFIGYGLILIELKALVRISSNEDAQLINYLKASDHSLGLLINFGAKSLEFKRFAGPNHSLEFQSVKSVESVDSHPFSKQ